VNLAVPPAQETCFSSLNREETKLAFDLGGSLKMRRSAAVLISVLAVTMVAPVFANTETVTGQLLDLACYSQRKEDTGNQHRGKGLTCAQACAREGFAVGLLTTDGKVYQVVGELSANSNAKLVPYMAQTVTITGDVSEKARQATIAGSDLKAIK
jgi:hypothetical protein